MDDVKRAVREGVEEALGVRFEYGCATPSELEVARELVSTRYGRDEWNLMR